MQGRGKKEPEIRRRRVVERQSSLPPAFSYHANRSVRQSNSAGQGRVPTIVLDERKGSANPKKKLLSLVMGIIAAVILLVLAIGLSSSPRIVLVQPEGFSYQAHSLAVYQAAVSKAMNSSLFDQNKLTFSTNDIALAVKKDFPEVEYVTVKVPFIGSTPTVYLQLDKPVLAYATSSGVYLLDSNGVVIGPSTLISSNQLAQLFTVSNPSLGQPNLGSELLSQPNVAFIETVGLALKAKAVSISKMILVPGAEELDVYPQGQPYLIKFNIYQTDALQQVGTYLATMATLKQQGKTPGQYVDVRVDGRAYYK